MRKLLGVVTFCSAVSLAATGSATPAQKVGKDTAKHSEAAVELRQDMRKLWTDHVVWTRDYIIAALANAPEAPSALNRLMKNQDDIGAAVAKFYGDSAGKQLTTLLKDHIAIAGDLIKAAKAGDKSGQQAADDRWQKNAMQIADFLSKANPHWPKPTVEGLMKMHLSTTTNEVVARLNKNWDEDVRAFDAVYDHILHMADALSDGIIQQFPNRFGAGVVSTTGKK